jgi:hypothetical protein
MMRMTVAHAFSAIKWESSAERSDSRDEFPMIEVNVSLIIKVGQQSIEFERNLECK